MKRESHHSQESARLLCLLLWNRKWNMQSLGSPQTNSGYSCGLAARILRPRHLIVNGGEAAKPWSRQEMPARWNIRPTRAEWRSVKYTKFCSSARPVHDRAGGCTNRNTDSVQGLDFWSSPMTNRLGKNEQFSSQRERKWFKVRQKIEVELRRVQECQAADYTQDLSTLMHKCLKSTGKRKSTIWVNLT